MRPPRRSSPVTILLATLLAGGFLFFLFSSSSSSSSTSSAASSRRPGPPNVASHVLSPPTSPVRKTRATKAKPGQAGGRGAPPPVVRYQLNNLTTSRTPIEGRETVLILTPLARFFPAYWANLQALTYPHDLISLGFIIPKTREGEAACTALQAAVALTQSGPGSTRFASVTILRQDFEPAVASQEEGERHKLAHQKARRAAMARARNSLLFTTLGPFTAWVLWLDADVVETPPGLIQDLAAHDKPILAPNCFQRYRDPATQRPAIRPYDFNNWRDSDEAQKLAAAMPKDDILLEGYGEMATWRLLMAKTVPLEAGAQAVGPDVDRHQEMALDGVGGTALLVKAEVHRDGAMFPPFAFYHLIETEGFAKMAKRLGWESWGLPNYLVYHYDE
ncbi:MAG: Golgi mannosyltransferase complex subunit [Phylliscum demangeonii]|nr:MAG: Golgi mannosyltransferase complex subunit [Phylliscum demangeonii]